MQLNHLHIRVRDADVSMAFYDRWFALKEKVRHGNIVFLTDGSMDFALAPGPGADDVPSWFHFGFRLDSADAVRSMYGAMTGASVPIAEPLTEDAELVYFRALDPDGYHLEIYFE